MVYFVGFIQKVSLKAGGETSIFIDTPIHNLTM